MRACFLAADCIKDFIFTYYRLILNTYLLKKICITEKKRLPLSSQNRKPLQQGVVLEWLKRHAWKACIRQKRIGGSNPPHSAINAENQQIAKQTPSFAPKNVKSGVFVLFKIIQPLHNKRVAILKESDEKRLIFIYPFTLIFQDFTSS